MAAVKSTERSWSTCATATSGDFPPRRRTYRIRLIWSTVARRRRTLSCWGNTHLATRIARAGFRSAGILPAVARALLAPARRAGRPPDCRRDGGAMVERFDDSVCWVD